MFTLPVMRQVLSPDTTEKQALPTIKTHFDPNGFKGGRSGCWRARVPEAPGINEAGVSEAEAIGNVLISHPEMFRDGVIIQRGERRPDDRGSFLMQPEATD